ncbi:Dehydrogenase/reductase SDR family member 7 [Carex littledalei]|uniref:Dehydrogenase/reductase SDR family member 7 n=1 Tax=Carex littledalei TaxID=544730 RepID=A0A833RN06_9POAL|nr:Dehydrogenase/reductase SDR family member 7 [Carex littledalei]
MEKNIGFFQPPPAVRRNPVRATLPLPPSPSRAMLPLRPFSLLSPPSLVSERRYCYLAMHGQFKQKKYSGGSEKRVPSERCAELTIVAATHGLKETWILYKPVLLVMYLGQYMPTVGYWLMDKAFRLKL